MFVRSVSCVTYHVIYLILELIGRENSFDQMSLDILVVIMKLNYGRHKIALICLTKIMEDVSMDCESHLRLRAGQTIHDPS